MALADEASPTQVDRLRAVATLTSLLFRTPKALALWRRNNPTGEEAPTDYVIASGGFETFEGLVIDGSWDEVHGWDYDSKFKLFTDDAEIITCYGWNLDIKAS